MWRNHEIAELTRLSPAMVSRLRTGRQNPGWRTMLAFESGLGWPISDQARAASRGLYSVALNEYLDTVDYATILPPRLASLPVQRDRVS